MNHEEIKAKALEFFDRDLGSAEKQEIENHLRACPECRTFFGEWERVHALLGSLKNPAPSEKFVLNVMSQIEEISAPAAGPAKSWQWPSWLSLTLGYGIAAVLMIVVLNQPTFAATTTESVLLSEVPESAQWAFMNETVHAVPLLGAEGENV